MSVERVINMDDSNIIEAVLFTDNIYTKKFLKSMIKNKNDWNIGDEYYAIKAFNRHYDSLNDKSTWFKIKDNLVKQPYCPDKYIRIENGCVGAIIETSDGRYPAYNDYDGYQIETGGSILLSLGCIEDLLFETYEQAMDFVQIISSNEMSIKY